MTIDVSPAPTLSRVNGVELVHAGTWAASTGVCTFTPADLAAAVSALDCPAVRRPILKLGHEDPRFDGEPAVGYVDNMAVTGDTGGSLTGDFCGMPGWLATADADGHTVLASAYPDRSIEGAFGFQCQLGHTHPFVIHAVALLGVTRPGVGTLGSLQDVAALYGVAAGAPAVEETTTMHVSLAVNIDQVRREYYAEAPLPWWIQEVHLDPPELIVADDETGKMYRVSVSTEGDTVTFGSPVQVVTRYEDVPDTQNVAASIAAAGGVRYPSRDASRPGSTITDPQEEPVPVLTDEQTVALATRLGLAADADGDTIVSALDEALTEQAEPPEPTPPAPLPEGVVTIDSATLAQMQDDAAAGRAARDAQIAQERDDLVAAAVKDGRIPASRRDAWVTQLAADPGAAPTLASLAKGTVPVEQMGYAGGDEPGDAQLDAISASVTRAVPEKVS